MMARELGCERGATEIQRSQLWRQYGASFRQAYIELIANLNGQHHSFAWWIMPFTTKNPLSTSLCHSTFYAVAIAKLATEDERPLVVLTENVELTDQLEHWGRQAGVRVMRAVRGTARMKRWLKYGVPVALVAAWLRTGTAWLLARRLRPARSTKPCVVVATTVPQSRIEPSGYREAYFAPLLEHLEQQGVNPMVFAVLLTRPIRSLRVLRRLSLRIPVVPVEACLNLSDLLRCQARSILQWLACSRARFQARLEGVDVSRLVQHAVVDSYRSSSFFKHLCIAAGAGRLVRHLAVDRWYYPFENRAMERALLLGVRGVSSKTRMVGCQNAALTPSHTNFVLGQAEVGVLPLPDAVFTTGDTVRQWMETEGHFPPGLLRVGCALRQHRPLQTAARVRPDRMRRVLVALASSVEEYVETILFLEEVRRGGASHQIRLRPHPEFPIEEAQRVLPSVTWDAYDISQGPLAEDLAWADVVLYASSTVGFEAVSQGLPAIHLQLNQILNSDPLFGVDDCLKWTVQSPAQLASVLQAIELLSLEQFAQRQQQGRNLADQYFLPVTQERLQKLVEAS